jgi:hypothetical protein
MGVTERQFRSRAPTAKERAASSGKALTREEAGREGGRGKKAVDTVNSFVGQNGNHADYLTRRIARDRPDILDRMKAGEYPSVRAAAL